jgi:hypothetical protein
MISGPLTGAWRAYRRCGRYANRFFAETPTVRAVGAAIAQWGTDRALEPAFAAKFVNRKTLAQRRCRRAPLLANDLLVAHEQG